MFCLQINDYFHAKMGKLESLAAIFSMALCNKSHLNNVSKICNHAKFSLQISPRYYTHIILSRKQSSAAC